MPASRKVSLRVLGFRGLHLGLNFWSYGWGGPASRSLFSHFLQGSPKVNSQLYSVSTFEKSTMSKVNCQPFEIIVFVKRQLGLVWNLLDCSRIFEEKVPEYSRLWEKLIRTGLEHSRLFSNIREGSILWRSTNYQKHVRVHLLEDKVWTLNLRTRTKYEGSLIVLISYQGPLSTIAWVH